MRIVKAFLSFIVALTIITPVYAEDNYYHIYEYKNDGSKEELDYFSSYSRAYSFFKKQLGNYDNVGIELDNKIIELESGIASLRNDDCTDNIIYKDLNGKQGYVNGCYVGDLAYLKTNKKAASVRLKVSGIIADFDIDDVILYPTNQLNSKISSYVVIDGILYHQISTNINSDIYNSMLKLGKAPKYLGKEPYLSYDGHYFYEDYKTMIKDYNNSTYENSVNRDSPYYSYYMYLPQRTYSNYSPEDINNYLENTLLIESKIDYYYDLNRDYSNDILNTSQLYGEIEPFFAYQYQYGANALMMLSLSFNESGYGRSRFAYNRNNLFGHSAYDNDIEKNASRYSSISASVRSHAKYYISGSYGNATKYSYTGSYFGNKLSGMNVNYASDPYWGEKAAHYTYSIDEALGLKDYGTYLVGIVEDADDYKIYSDESLKSIEYTINDFKDYSLAILAETDNLYKVALDKPLDQETYTYDFEKAVGYVPKDSVDYIIGDSTKEASFVEVEYKSDNGLYNDQENIIVKVDNNHTDPIFKPFKEGFEFKDYKKETTDNKIIYTAKYKEIDSIELVNFDDQEVEVNWYLDLRDAYLKINYKGLGSSRIPITSDMLSDFDLSTLGTYEAKVNYAGLSIPIKINVTSTDDLIRSDINKILELENPTIIDAYKVKELSKQIDGYYTMNQIRKLDSLILNDTKDKITYSIAKNKYNLGVSGLGLAIEFSNLTQGNNPFKDTIEVKTSSISSKSEERLNKIAEAYGYVPIEAFEISIVHNIDEAIINTPLVFSVSHKNYDPSQIYMVYLLNKDGDLVKLNTSVSDGSIEFMTYQTGSFVICYKKTNNVFKRFERFENTNAKNSALSFAEYFLKISIGLAVAMVFAMGIIQILKMRTHNGRKITKNHRRSRSMLKKKS